METYQLPLYYYNNGNVYLTHDIISRIIYNNNDSIKKFNDFLIFRMEFICNDCTYIGKCIEYIGKFCVDKKAGCTIEEYYNIIKLLNFLDFLIYKLRQVLFIELRNIYRLNNYNSLKDNIDTIYLALSCLEDANIFINDLRSRSKI